MRIDEINAEGAGTCFGGFKVSAMLRTGAAVYCEADCEDIEKLWVEFEDEGAALEFEESVENGTARLVLEEDTRKQFWDDLECEPEMKEKFEAVLLSGDRAQLEAVLDDLWNEYGIIGYDDPAPERSGIKRLAVMHSHGVVAFGFKGQTKELERWMERNSFNPEDPHHCQLEMFD